MLCMTLLVFDKLRLLVKPFLAHVAGEPVFSGVL